VLVVLLALLAGTAAAVPAGAGALRAGDFSPPIALLAPQAVGDPRIGGTVTCE
jgi:hypothetical protein